ncbi:MAG: hypothetical protein CMO55_08035 [Verrucomicrobiales bacterium]|nr:hypothetical protein [Verrucomicrobiales bacterium]
MIALNNTVSVLVSTTTIRLEKPISIGGNWVDFGGDAIAELSEADRYLRQKKRDPDYEARLKQIGDILARGVACLLAKEEREREVVAEQEVRKTVKLTPDESKILGLVSMFGSVSPADLGDHLKLSRASVARRTNSLQQKGFLRGEGKTSALKYYLTPAGRSATNRSNY